MKKLIFIATLLLAPVYAGYATDYAKFGNVTADNLGVSNLTASGDLKFIPTDVSVTSVAYVTNDVNFYNSWHDLSVSADGQVLLCCGYGSGEPYYMGLSTDSGTNWATTGVQQYWPRAICSGNGAVYAAIGYAADSSQARIYTSTDAGTNWTIRDSPRTWTDLAISYDGTKIIAGVENANAGVYASSDGGTNWARKTTSAEGWITRVAMSTNGSHIYSLEYVTDNTYLRVSTNFGTDWTTLLTVTESLWYTATLNCSLDGRVIAIADGTILPYVSKDYGASWSRINAPASLSKINVAPDDTLIANVLNHLYASPNLGNNWYSLKPGVDEYTDSFKHISRPYTAGKAYYSGSPTAGVFTGNWGYIEYTFNYGSLEVENLTTKNVILQGGMLPNASNTVDLGSQTMPFRSVNASNFNVVGSSISFNGVTMMTATGGSLQVASPIVFQEGTNAPVAYASEDSVAAVSGRVSNVEAQTNSWNGAVTSSASNSNRVTALENQTNSWNSALTPVGGTFTNPVYSTVDHLATAPAANEFPTADWVRSLSIQGAEWYYSTATTNFSDSITNMSLLQRTVPVAVFTNITASPTPADTYVGSGITTASYSNVKSPVTFEMYLARVGGNSSSIIPVYPEVYYVYNGTTNLLGDWEVPSQNVNSTVPTKFTWTVSFTEPSVTSSVKIVGRLKTGTPLGSAAALAIYGGGVYGSRMDIPGVEVGSVVHNALGGLQGGTTDEYYHLTQADHTMLTNNVMAFNLALQDPTNGLAYWLPNPFGTRSCTLVEAYVKTYGMTGTVDLISQHRTDGWYTYSSLTSGIPATTTGTAQSSFTGSTAVTNGMRIGFIPNNLSAFAVTNMVSIDFMLRTP